MKTKNESPLEVMRSFHQEFVESREREFTWSGVIEHLLLVGRYFGYLEMLRAYDNRDLRIVELVKSVDSAIANSGSIYSMLLDCMREENKNVQQRGLLDEIMRKSSAISAFQLIAANLKVLRSIRRKDMLVKATTADESTKTTEAEP